MILRTILSLVSLTICFFAPKVVLATKWYVDASATQSGSGTTWGNAFKTIQEGIDAASKGDTVIVAEGTYVENIHFKGKNITLTGTDPLDPLVVDNTVIDGSQAGSVVTFSGTEDRSCILSGFTIRNGKAQDGGGILGHGCLATVRNNSITGNEVMAADTSHGGGGIHSCHGDIQNNSISHNSAGIHGGGLFNCNGNIKSNSITHNSAVFGGAGLYDCQGTIKGNEIILNSAGQMGGGLFSCHGTVQNNNISSNDAGDMGGGLDDCDGTVRNNKITHNSGGGLSGCHGTIQGNDISWNSAYCGGGLQGCDATVRNNTIKDNSARASGGGLAWCDGSIEFNTIESNTAQEDGGGLFICKGTIYNNNIAQNSAEQEGGGLYDCDGLIDANTITQNSASGHGAGLYECDGPVRGNIIARNLTLGNGGGLAWCDGHIENNLIHENFAESGGGLIFCNGTIRNNLITGNNAGTDGGGLYWCVGAIHNNTVLGNIAASGGGLIFCSGILNCIIWNNFPKAQGSQVYLSATPEYSCIEDWSGGGDGNISLDPKFRDPDGPDDVFNTYEDNDLRLSANSPCIDAGRNEPWMWEAVDLHGNFRIWRGISSLTADMGASEYGSTPFEVTEVILDSTGKHVTWNSQPGVTYTVWVCDNLLTGSWVKLGAMSSQGETTSYSDVKSHHPGWRILFYRVASPPSVFRNGVVGHWMFDEDSGMTAEDSSGTNNHGTLVGTPQWVDGIIGGALRLDGGTYVNCGNHASLNLTTGITVAAWVKTNDAATSQHIPYVTKGDNCFALKHYVGNSIEFHIYDGTWRAAVSPPVDTSFNGVWHHLAGTYDGSEVSLYIDGNLQAATPHAGSISSTTYDVNIGRNSQVTDRFYDGAIDDVRIYDRAFSEKEIEDLYSWTKGM